MYSPVICNVRSVLGETIDAYLSIDWPWRLRAFIASIRNAKDVYSEGDAACRQGVSPPSPLRRM
jgi:hypothetical protein